MKRPLQIGVLGCALVCGAVRAQSSAADLAALEETAQKRHAEWDALAKDLELRVARILPCDPRSSAAITEVSRASAARLAALADYLRAATVQAFAETASAKILLNSEDKRAAEAVRERSDAAQEQTAVDMQSDALAQSVKQRPSLQEPQKSLDQIAALIHQRSAAAEQHAAGTDVALAMLRELVAKFDARDAALRDESAALEAERARWTGYYSARLARAQVECSITRIGPVRPGAKQ